MPFGLLLLALSAAPAAPVLILGSDGPSAGRLRPGTKLVRGQKLTLRRQDTLALLDGGVVRRVRGPQAYVVGSAPSISAAPTALAVVERRSRLGASRATPPRKGSKPAPARKLVEPPSADRPHIWYVDADRDKVACTTRWDGMQGLWRRDGSKPEEVIIKNSAGETVDTISFTVGVRLAYFPKKLATGQTYELLTPGGKRIRLTKIPEPADPDPNERISRLSEELIKSGCYAQLDYLTKLLEKSGPT